MTRRFHSPSAAHRLRILPFAGICALAAVPAPGMGRKGHVVEFPLFLRVAFVLHA